MPLGFLLAWTAYRHCVPFLFENFSLSFAISYNVDVIKCYAFMKTDNLVEITVDPQYVVTLENGNKQPTF